MSSSFADQQRPRIRVPMREDRGSCGVSANENSCAHRVTWSPNKLWRSPPYLTYDQQVLLYDSLWGRYSTQEGGEEEGGGQTFLQGGGQWAQWAGLQQPAAALWASAISSRWRCCSTPPSSSSSQPSNNTLQNIQQTCYIAEYDKSQAC